MQGATQSNGNPRNKSELKSLGGGEKREAGTVQARCRDPQSLRRSESTREPPARPPALQPLSISPALSDARSLSRTARPRHARRAHPPEGSGLQAGKRRTAAGGSGPGGQHHVEAVAHLGG